MISNGYQIASPSITAVMDGDANNNNNNMFNMDITAIDVINGY